MAYVKQNFVDGNVLNAAELNHMEDGIADAYIKPSSGIPSGDIANGAVIAGKIGANAVSTQYTATLDTTWSGSAAPYSKSQTISGLLATDKAIVDLVPSSTYSTAEDEIEAWGYVYRVDIANNTATFYATEKPTVSLSVKILCVRK